MKTFLIRYNKQAKDQYIQAESKQGAIAVAKKRSVLNGSGRFLIFSISKPEEHKI